MNERGKALKNLENFIKIIYKLFVEEKVDFDLVIGAGDSGIVMVKFVELILEELETAFPKKLVLPSFRFNEKHVPRGVEFDNYSLAEEVKNIIGDIKLKNILFVDDEINRARTLHGVIKIIRKVNFEAITPETNLYITAEDRGFTADLIEGLNIKFFPFGEKIEGLNNVIMKIIPTQIRENLEREYGEFYSAELVCVLLNLPVKEIKEGKPYWSNALFKDVNTKVPDLENYQKEFEIYLREFIKEKLFIQKFKSF